MLKDREIDLLADVSITPGRQNQRLFSAYAMGMENYDLYVSDRVCEVDALDYTTLNGKKIGTNAGSVQLKLCQLPGNELPGTVIFVFNDLKGIFAFLWFCHGPVYRDIGKADCRIVGKIFTQAYKSFIRICDRWITCGKGTTGKMGYGSSSKDQYAKYKA